MSDSSRRRTRLATVVIAILVVGAALALRWNDHRPAATTAPAELPLPTNNRPATGTPAQHVDEARSDLADELNSPRSDIRADLRIVALMLDTFRSNFPHDGNPVGANVEITAALTGRNRLKLSLIPPDHPAINARGELCDRWGTPFFFHAESGTRMEVRSAGPDRKMWNQDDVVLGP